MKITVVTVCFNAATTIGRTLHSVRAQTHADVEHIVVDGGSDDGTLGVVAREGIHVAHVSSGKDKGIYDAMNKGVRIATGDAVAFLNADDYYKDGEVLATVARVMHGENLDALYGDVEFFREHAPDTVVRRYDSGQFTPSRLGWGWMPAHPALFVRRAVFQRFGAFRTNYRIAGDFEFIARVFSHSDLSHRHLPQSLVRMQLGGISTSGWRANLRINQEMLRACRENGIATNWLKLLARYPAKATEFLRA